MEKTPDLIALSPFLTPLSPKENAASFALDGYAQTWDGFKPSLTDLVQGLDMDMLEDGLVQAASYGVGVDQINSAVVDGLITTGTFSSEKADWLAERGYAVRPSLPQAPNDAKRWAAARDDAAFDWALLPLANAPDSKQRDEALMMWLSSILANHHVKEDNPPAPLLWVARRVEAIELARPGIVRQWLSEVPRHNPASNMNSNSNASSPELEKRQRRDHLHRFFKSALRSSCPEKLANWLDPGCYGHPVCAHLIMESGLETGGDTSLMWSNLSRALACRPAAQAFWAKQTRPGNLVPVMYENKVLGEHFPSQHKVFADFRVGRNRYSGNQQAEKNADDRLPLDLLGRLMAKDDPFVKRLPSLPGGKEQIIACMKSHPVFMAHGFARYGVDLLSWKEAEALDDFRDVHGYGAARYALSLCNYVTSSFDVCLHRYLRQRKPLCDDQLPKLDLLFVEEAAKAKYRAMELRKTARVVSKEVVRERPVRARVM